MVRGLGLDLVDLSGFAEQLGQPGSAFEAGVFTAAERRAARSRPSGDPVRHLAARYAAKEAFVKAWSATARGRPPALRTVDLSEVELVQDAWGRPALRLHGRVGEIVAEAGWDVQVSLSHDGGMAGAVVVISGG